MVGFAPNGVRLIRSKPMQSIVDWAQDLRANVTFFHKGGKGG